MQNVICALLHSVCLGLKSMQLIFYTYPHQMHGHLKRSCSLWGPVLGPGKFSMGLPEIPWAEAWSKIGICPQLNPHIISSVKSLGT